MILPTFMQRFKKQPFHMFQMYVCWYENSVANEVTKPRFGSVYPWPLNKIIPYWRQKEITNKLKSIGWTQKSLEEVRRIVFSPLLCTLNVHYLTNNIEMIELR